MQRLQVVSRRWINAFIKSRSVPFYVLGCNMLWPQALFSAWLRSISFVFQAKYILFYSTIVLRVFHVISSLKALYTFEANNWQDKMVLPWSPNSAARFERLDFRRCLCGSLSSCGQHDRFLNFLSSWSKGLNPLIVKKVRSFKELRQDLTALPHVIDIFNKVTKTMPVMMTFTKTLTSWPHHSRNRKVAYQKHWGKNF